jgi:hypothetical protein
LRFMVASFQEKLDKNVPQRLKPTPILGHWRRGFKPCPFKTWRQRQPESGLLGPRLLKTIFQSIYEVNSREFLYRRLPFAAISVMVVGLFGWAAPLSVAQDKPQLKRPHDTIDEKPAQPKKKNVKGPRAIGVLQLTSSGKGLLIPIAILIDGRFYDAGAYKADPVPMALESGTVYEAEQSGDSQGLFTVIGALHSKSGGSANPWMGTGSFLPHGSEVAKTTHKAEDVPVGLDNSDEPPPRLTKKNVAPTNSPPSGAAETPASPTPTTTSSGQSTPKSSSPTSPDAPSDKPAASDKTATENRGAQTPQSGSSKDSSQGPAESSGEYYRPALRRGKPTQSAPEEESVAKASAAKGGKAETAGEAKTSGGEAVQLLPAISDASGPDPRSYKFFWKSGEEEEKRNLMLALAAREVRLYAAEQAKNQIPAKPAAVKAVGRKAAAKAVDPVFEKLQFHAYDVWVNNQPVMILTAEAHFPPGGGVATASSGYSIALVARTDIYGDLRKLYSGITDKSHLDVTPQLDFIDAVDADGDGRGELLFRETSDAGSGYVIYRATADKLWKMFDSLNAM